MATTLRFESFARSNIRERTALSSAVPATSTSLPVESAEGFEAGHIIYVGEIGRETCERAVIDAVSDATTLPVTTALEYAHSAFGAVPDPQPGLNGLFHFERGVALT